MNTKNVGSRINYSKDITSHSYMTLSTWHLLQAQKTLFDDWPRNQADLWHLANIFARDGQLQMSVDTSAGGSIYRCM